MTSRIISRFLPAPDEPSANNTMDRHRPPTESPDVEERAGLDIDEANLGERFQDQDLEHLLAEAENSEIGPESTAFAARSTPAKPPTRNRPSGSGRPRWTRSKPKSTVPLDDDDDVPESLLLDADREGDPLMGKVNRLRQESVGELPAPVPGPSTRNTRAQWEATRAQQRLHDDRRGGKQAQAYAAPVGRGPLFTDPKERAMWQWANVQNLDGFLLEVYQYFEGHGIWSIMLGRFLSLLQSAFAIALTVFLTSCIDWPLVSQKNKLQDVLIPHCTKNMSGALNLLLWCASLFWIFTLFHSVYDIPRLWRLHNFYHYLLGIPDRDVQTVSWQIVVMRLMALRDANPVTAQNLSSQTRRYLGTQSKQRMDAHDIANRLMRRENYLIALFNKDILDLAIPLPFLGSHQFYSQTMQWHVGLCVMDYVFNEENQIRLKFLSDRNRKELVEGLRRRFFWVGVLSIIWSPFGVAGYLISYFLRFFTEYHRNPGQIGARMFTPLAEWKFREFNELPHLFQRRRNMAYPYADRYLDQFPKDKSEKLAGFVRFVSGGLAGVLALATALDSELFLGFEITPGRTVLFYLSVLYGIYQSARNMMPEEDLVLDPKFALEQVIQCTHYCPNSWKGALHSDEVRREFSSLYQMRILVHLEEVLSMIMCPFVLLYSLPRCSERLIDFFREFTIHVDGLGHVCSFAVFDFKRGSEHISQPKPGQPGGEGLRDDYYATRDDKMLASYYGFLDNYATNTKGGALHGRSPHKPLFYPPPAFPGLNSPALHAEVDGALGSRQPPMRQSRYLTPRFGPTAGRASPMHSILLDPHHQPSMSAARGSPRQTAQTRHRGPRPLRPDPNDLEEADEEENKDDITTSRLMAEDSNLGDSWRTTRAAQDDEESDTDAAGAQGGGVLGLLYQFQKAQTGQKQALNI